MSYLCFFSLSFFIYSLHTYLASLQHLFSMSYLLCFFSSISFFVYSLYTYIETFVFFALPMFFFSFFLHLLTTYIFGFFATFVSYALPMFLFFYYFLHLHVWLLLRYIFCPPLSLFISLSFNYLSLSFSQCLSLSLFLYSSIS